VNVSTTSSSIAVATTICAANATFADPMNVHTEWLTEYGYAGMFATWMLGIVAVPVPEETILTFSGFLVYNGTFRLLPACATGFLGSVCGITLSYTLGRSLGIRAVRRFGRRLHVDAEKLERVRRWFGRAGKWLLPVAYFIPGVRHFAALVAGTSRLELPVFAVFAYAGALVWSQSFIAIGYFFGPEWETALNSVDRHRWIALATFTAALLAPLAAKYRRRPST
jgi:membrane protein DedA with SNARE-associated domain